MKDWDAHVVAGAGADAGPGPHGPSGSFADSRLGSAASTALDRWALRQIQRMVDAAPLRFALWDGFELSPIDGARPVGAICFHTRAALMGWVWDPELNFGETYMSGAVEIRGDLLDVLAAINRGFGETRRPWWLKGQTNDVRAARENVHHHYDLGNDFYRLWLDREMVYTCAYFPTPGTTLEDAQLAKMDLVCRKLQLKPGDRVLEAGCGWGALALHMARGYGASVRAFNVSTEQIAYAKSRAKAEGLEGQVEFVEDDYRRAEGVYDAFVSIGMLEHVGLPDFPGLGRMIDRSLTPDGRGLLHFIGRNHPAPLNAWIRKRIFPGAYPPTLREVFEHVLEPQGLSVFDVENLRLHYAKTLEHWRQRFDGAADQVATMFDPAFVRAWWLYLTGSQASFTTGSLQLFQVLFVKGQSNNVPWTRVGH